ncbi:alpha/beta hydrolase [Pseudoxanthomonas gei]|uniref:Alpha/beta hydrolase n=1 Tax=Pseudoxanthomonas gei TaxID=1383030 RepID=A0ABX0AB14_9GAMM|nr:alpha/beta hydrolase [Pseudoxanthomonas gei]NDK38758.1 alpha/beta hydrolase [Pseudoxanthomonas gei]
MSAQPSQFELPRPLESDQAVDPRETAHLFGAGLVGILHAAAGPAHPDVAVILLNAGMVHRIGPHRGSVELARAVAGAGYPVFRYDQSGLGDSPVSAHVSAERRHLEITSAMALVTARTGATRFVVGGICSAADDAFHLASIEPRIHGLLLLDGLAYRTAGYWWRHLAPRVFSPVKWANWWRSRSDGSPGMENFRDWPSRQQAVATMQAMVARDVRFLFVFTGGAYRYFNHAGQLVACLGRAARSTQTSLAYWRDCDHTFYLQRDRARLQALVTAWMEREFPTEWDRGAAAD